MLSLPAVEDLHFSTLRKLARALDVELFKLLETKPPILYSSHASTTTSGACPHLYRFTSPFVLINTPFCVLIFIAGVDERE
jgi:hypothetical protein